MNRLFLKVLLLALVFPGAVLADSPVEESLFGVPHSLKEWVPWVRYRLNDRGCPQLASGQEQCVWLPDLLLGLNDGGGSFELKVRVFGELPGQRGEIVRLPGGGGVWPSEVSVSGARGEARVAVRAVNGVPAVELTTGEYLLRGRLTWGRLPERLAVPAEVGLVRLKLPGEELKHVGTVDNGQIILTRAVAEEVAAEEKDQVAIRVFRKLADGSPIVLESRMQLRVTGKGRNFDLGQITSEGFSLVQLKSPLPLSVDAAGLAKVKLTPGEYWITLTEVAQGGMKEFSTIPNITSDWPTQEVWSFEPNTNLRSVEISATEGGSAVDPEVAGVPAEWHSLVSYQLPKGGKLVLQENQRGESLSQVSALTLRRTLWLDLSGQSLAVQDQFGGTMRSGWRLNAQPPLELGSVKVNGEPQLLSIDPENKQVGVELRGSAINLVASGRQELAGGRIKAVGWDQGVDSLGITLNIPPGFRLLAASGVDHVYGSWFSRWDLLMLFFVTLLSAAVYRLFGRMVGGIALLTLLLLVGEIGAPLFIWIPLVASVALARVLKAGRFRRWVWRFLALLVLMLGLSAVPYSSRQILKGLFPQLDGARYYYQQAESAAPRSMAAKGVDYSEEEGRTFDAQILAAPASDYLSLARQKLQQVDPKAIIQTGPALPEWRFDTAELSWSGPVSAGEEVQLYLLGPISMLIISFLRALLPLLGLAFFAREFWRLRKVEEEQVKSEATVGVGAALALMLIAISPSRELLAQEFPPERLLKELEQRVVSGRCQGECVSIEAVRVELSESRLIVKMVVSSSGNSSVVLPGPTSVFLPEKVELKPLGSADLTGVLTGGLPNLSRDSAGMLRVALKSGVFELSAEGQLPVRNMHTLRLPDGSNNLSVSAAGWRVDGFDPNTGQASGSIQFVQEQQEVSERKAKDEWRVVLKPQYELTREIFVGVDWRVVNTLRRLGDLTDSALVEVPLIRGEAPFIDFVEGDTGLSVMASFAPQQQEFTWEGAIGHIPELKLKAEVPQLIEIWKLSCSSVFRCRSSGVPATSTLQAGSAQTLWNPRLGEEVAVQVTKPAGAPGILTTVDAVDLRWSLGERRATANLAIRGRSSEGGVIPVRIGEQARVQSAQVNGRDLPLVLEKGVLSAPIGRGEYQISMAWEEDFEWRIAQGTSQVALQLPLSNITVGSSLPPRRWVLWASGPSWGPVFLFWRDLILVLLLALALGKYRIAGLGNRSWVLLGLGLVQLPAILMLPIPLWLAALEQRRKSFELTRGWFNLRQLALVVLTFFALVSGYVVVSQGLVGDPKLSIVGSYGYELPLTWFSDQSAGEIPAPVIYSLPIWVWRGFMLIWSTWFAVTLLRWLRWGWECFSAGEMIWKEREKRVLKSEEKPQVEGSAT